MKKFTIILTVLIAMTFTTNAQWQQINDSCNGYVYSVAINGNNIFEGTGTCGMFLSPDNGSNWASVNNGLPTGGQSTVEALAISGSNIYTCIWGNGVYLSSDNGNSWTSKSYGLQYMPDRIAVSGSKVYATAGNVIYYSSNSGNSWTSITSNFPVDDEAGPLLIKGNSVFVGTGAHAGTSYRGDGIFLSNNNGASWTSVNTGLHDTSLVFSLALSGNNIFAGTNFGIYMSSDNGSSWTAVNTGITDNWVEALAVNGNNLFAGTTSGAFWSSNNGALWTQINAGLTSTYITSLAVNGSNIVAGTFGGGVWKLPLAGLGIKEINNNESNITIFPNPASDIITLNIDNTNNTDLTLNIYNVIGTLVKSETLKQNQRQINIGDLSNSVYIIAINSKDLTEYQRLLIQR